jgi:hypothetical protein
VPWFPSEHCNGEIPGGSERKPSALADYYSGKWLNRCKLSRCQAERGARRGKPQPPVQRTSVRQPARSIPTRAAPEDRPSRSRRPSLPAIGSLRRLGGVAESPEKLVAACRGGHPPPPLREVMALDIFTFRINNLAGLKKWDEKK